MKKLLAIILIGVMAVAMFGCSKSDPQKTDDSIDNGKPSKQEDSTDKKDDATVAEEGVTVTMWSKFSPTSANGESIQKLVDDFNATNKKAITVEVLFIEGGTSGIMSKVMADVAAGTTPEIIMIDNSTIPILAENGVIADISTYVEANGYDMSNIIDEMSLYSYYEDQIISVPFARSNVVYYYNEDIFEKNNLTPPKNFEDVENIGKTLLENEGIPSMSILFDASFYQEALLVGMGSEGNVSKDGNSPAALEDGTMEELLTIWKGWIDAGWCDAANVTDAETTMKEAFYNGELAGFIASTGAMKGIYNACAEMGVNFGVSYMPGQNGYATGAGGSGLCAIASDKTDEQIAASYEFMEFMMSDNSVSYFSINSGYMPTTYSSLETQEMAEYWAEYPGFKVAVDQMEYASEPFWSVYRSEWNSVVKTAMSSVTQNGEEVSSAIDYMKSQVDAIFSN
jgi:sn-glycerol 3-phosphate transport system substrate-binding protein